MRGDELRQAERETVADLSHRVRTSLTALRLNLETLRDPEEARRLVSDVDEVERSVNQVIEHARLPARQSMPPTSSLTNVLRARIEFRSVLATDQGRTLTKVLPAGEVAVPVPGDQLEAVIDALVGNVLADRQYRRGSARPGVQVTGCLPSEARSTLPDRSLDATSL